MNSKFTSLTPRQKDLLRRVASDLGYKAIAFDMGITESAVKKLARELHDYFGTDGSHSRLRKVASSEHPEQIVQQDLASKETLWGSLRPKEKQTALLYALGHLNAAQVGKLLGVTERSIEARLHMVYRIMGLSDTKRVGLVRYLSDRGMIIDNVDKIVAMFPPKENKVKEASNENGSRVSDGHSSIGRHNMHRGSTRNRIAVAGKSA